MMPRFVLLYHECPPGFIKPSHWDFMLEAEGVLETWELRELPSSWSSIRQNANAKNHSVVAKRLADHRLAYLAFEGPLTNDRGNVTRVAEGTFHKHEVNVNGLSVNLYGQTIQGNVTLTRIAGTDEWRLSVGD